MGPGTENPLEWTWDQAARQEVASYRDLPPPPQVNRMTDASENIPLPQTSFAGGKNDFMSTIAIPCQGSTYFNDL